MVGFFSDIYCGNLVELLSGGKSHNGGSSSNFWILELSTLSLQQFVNHGSDYSIPALVPVCVLITQSRPMFCDLMNCSPPGSSVHGILQARILEWVAIPFSRGSSWPRDWTCVSCIAGRFFTEFPQQFPITSLSWETVIPGICWPSLQCWRKCFALWTYLTAHPKRAVYFHSVQFKTFFFFFLGWSSDF